MSTPSPKYFCPRCRAAYDVDHLYCGRCGADMHRASRLTLARMEAEGRGGGRPSGARGTVEPEPAGAEAAAAPHRDATIDPWIGRLVDGRYRVRDLIGRGGMGVVYQVEHQRMGKLAAMKVLHGELAQQKAVLERFHREAEAVSRLTHPNTVQVFDFGVHGGQPYLVMEYVRGLDLGSLIDRDGPLGFERAAPLFAQICGALDEAHDLGVVHRDLKPENILVSRTHAGEDHVKVLDFGLAKLAEREESVEVTGRGSIVGTPYYMAPEQIRGEPVDARTDIYALGALMYRALTGEPPYAAGTPVGVLTKHLTETLVPPSRRRRGAAISPEVDALVVRALAKRPEQRWPSARALLDALEPAWQAVGERTGRLVDAGRGLGGRRRTADGGPAATDEPSERMLRRADLDDYERSLRRRRRVGLGVLPVLLAAAGGAAYYGWVWRAAQPRGAEVEPNDTFERATLIAPGARVTGRLGRRRSPTEGDRDVFRLASRPRVGREVLGVRLDPLPNMDLVLAVYDGSGQLLATLDEGGLGEAEVAHDLGGREPSHVVVEEARAPGPPRMPTENVSDRYGLTVELIARAPGVAAEPNDVTTDASPLAVGVATSGYLDRRDDVDLLRFDGAAGRYGLTIAAPAELPLRATWVGSARPGGAAPGPIDLLPGAVLRLERLDRALPHDRPLPGVDERYVVTLRPAP